MAAARARECPSDRASGCSMTIARSLVIASCLFALVIGVSSAQVSSDRWFSAGPISGARAHPGDAVRVWMSERLPTYGLVDGVDALRLEREESLPGGTTRVLIQQLWHGLPVAGADARAILGADGRITSILSGFERDLDAPLEPRVTPERAGALAAGASSRAAGILLDGATLAGATLAVARRADRDHLVWRVVHGLADGQRVRSLVDAVTGQVLEVDAGVHAVGNVYPTDPRQPFEERELTELQPGPPLSAPGFFIQDFSSPPALPVAPGDFRFQPGDPSFDQVNVFWHVEHYLRQFMQPLGYPGPAESLTVRMDYPMDPWVALTNYPYVMLGQPIAGFCKDVSLSHDVIYHEMGHTVIYGYGIQPGGPNQEASALHEGLADYFTAAFTGDPAIGEWLYITYPMGATRVDQPAPPWDYAHYNDVGFAGGPRGSSWGNGMILSSMLWDLRQQIGASADSLALEALVYQPTLPTWSQYADGLYLADRDHHGGRFLPVIAAMLGRRMIHGTDSAQIAGPSALEPAEPGQFHALPCCSGVPGRYHWRARGWCRGMPCEPWRDLGDDDSVSVSFTGDSQIELSVVSSLGDVDTARSFVSVGRPFLLLEGPTRVPKNATGTWNLRIAASAPLLITMYRQWFAPGGFLEPLGQRTTVSFPVTAPVRVSAKLIDGRGRSATAQLDVEPFTDKPPAESTRPVRLTQRVDGSGRAETFVEVIQATTLRISVYDLHGRERVKLLDDAQPRGARMIRWDTHVLEQGIYFVRAVTAAGQTADLRFLVLR